MELPLGHVVTIRHDLVIGESYLCEDEENECTMVREMTQYKGRKVTIADYDELDSEYLIEEDGENWSWAITMFEGYENFLE